MNQFRPRISAIVVTYNQSAFIEAALQSVFAQTYLDMEIVVTDDCSTDGTFEIVQKFVARYGAGRRVVMTQTVRNSGVAININNGVGAASGEILVMFAGDDVSLPTRCHKIADAFECDVYCVTSAADVVDINLRKIGYDPGWHGGKSVCAESFADSFTTICGASGAYHRKVFDLFGPLREGANCEDQILPFRAALLGRIALVTESLVLYRRHGKNISTPIDPTSTSSAAFIAHTKLWTAHKHLSMEQKVFDLKKYMHFSTTSQESLIGLEKVFEQALRQSDMMEGLAAHQLRAILTLCYQVVCGELRPKIAVKTFLMIFTPPLWLFYLRYFSRREVNRERQ